MLSNIRISRLDITLKKEEVANKLATSSFFIRVSSPKIALHKTLYLMEKKFNKYKKRTQKDYSMSFKLQLVAEVERGEISISEASHRYGIQGSHTVKRWLIKYGNFDWINKNNQKMAKTPERKILELEQKIKLLEKQKKQLEYQANQSDKKVILFDMMIDIAEKEFNIPIRKKSLLKQSTSSKENKKKA